MTDKKIFSVLMIVGMVIMTFTVMAQGPPPNPGSTGGPIDGGVTALVIGSAYYGYKKLKASREKKGE